ncbi:tellurite resistance TerB family protein [Desulfococcus sp.]|uniref:tellurite resistance TerB family protein n=1 Tax=Desulfococcus sp. TaxID=2025834 RepID=UPI00359420A8
MGLFDKIFSSSSNSNLSKPEAFAGIMLATVAADGHISDEEVAGFNAVISRMKLFQTQSASEHLAMIDKLFGILKRSSAKELLTKSAEVLPSELREAAFAVSADLIFADGSVEEEEKVLLETLQQQLGIPDDLAMQVVRVMEVKNRN